MMRSQRSRLEERLRQISPENSAVILTCSDRIIERLSDHNFSLVNNSSNSIPLVSNELRFERAQNSDIYAYIIVVIADNGGLGFGVSFGVRDLAPPHVWHCTASLGRRRIGFRKSCDLGAAWFTPCKVRKFRKDWEFFEDNVDAIVLFLETGAPNQHMVDALIFESFSPSIR